ncbi:MAG: hypothetical protein FWC32_00920 [Firmicutes bacterium]|nr:hypothetical protein [Bacillota bacterium]
MIMIVKVIWIVAIALNAVALAYFIVGSTAFFNRAFPDVAWGYYFVVIGFPVMILMIISIVCLVFGWIPRRTDTQITLITVTILITSLTVVLGAILPIQTEGWLTERVATLKHSPSGITIMRTTDDNKYEYFLEIINSGQRNSRAQLFVKNVVTGEEARILLDTGREIISTRMVSTPNEAETWAYLVSSDISPSIYILTTTQSINFEITSFEICMETKTSRKIE